MKFSIVTISFNQAEFLERALRSVIEQDYPDVEYIVTDPGSIDGSRENIDRCKQQIAKIIYERGQGPADGLNKGFSVAAGEIFGLINSEDNFLPGALSHLAAFLKPHPKIDVISGRALILDELDKVVRNSYPEYLSLSGYASGAVVLMQPSTLFRASSFRKTDGFNITNRTNWDGELFVDMCLQGETFALTNHFLLTSQKYRLQKDA